MRFIVMFVTAVCVLFLIKLRWPKKKNFYDAIQELLQFAILHFALKRLLHFELESYYISR